MSERYRIKKTRSGWALQIWQGSVLDQITFHGVPWRKTVSVWPSEQSAVAEMLRRIQRWGWITRPAV